MPVSLNKIVIFLGGALAGGAVGYFVSYKYFQKKYDEYRESFEDAMEQDEEELEEFSEEESSQVVNKFDMFGKSNDICNDSKYISGGTSQKEEKNFELDCDEKSPNFEYEIEGPLDIFAISEEDYITPEDSRGRKYGKVTLSYFEDDNAVVDDDENLMSDHLVVTSIGKTPQELFESHDHLIDMEFGYSECDDPDVLYVRNKELGFDFEIIRIHDAFREEDDDGVNEEDRRE